MVDLVRMVIFGGMDTVVAALSNMFVQIGRRPDLRARLLADATLIPGAIEEFLRFESPIQGFSRLATRDTEVGGRPRSKPAKRCSCCGAAQPRRNGLWRFERGIDPGSSFQPESGVRRRRAPLHRVECRPAELRLALEQVLQWIPDFVVRWDELVEA